MAQLDKRSRRRRAMLRDWKVTTFNLSYVPIPANFAALSIFFSVALRTMRDAYGTRYFPLVDPVPDETRVAKPSTHVYTAYMPRPFRLCCKGRLKINVFAPTCRCNGVQAWMRGWIYALRIAWGLASSPWNVASMHSCRINRRIVKFSRHQLAHMCPDAIYYAIY